MRAMQYAQTYGIQRVAASAGPHIGRQGRRGRERRGGVAARFVRRARRGGNHRAAYDLRTGARDGRAGASCPHVVGGGLGADARGKGRRLAGHVRRRRTSRSSDRKRHRLLRRAVPPRRRRCVSSAIAMRFAQGCSTARSMRSAPITRPSTTTKSCCRSARPRPAPPVWSCCCHWP
jgi:hypothetical protein